MVARQLGVTVASLSGNGVSGVRRMSADLLSGPLVGSTRMTEPAVMAWWAAAVAMMRFDPGTACGSQMPTGLKVALPERMAARVPSGLVVQRCS